MEYQNDTQVRRLTFYPCQSPWDDILVEARDSPMSGGHIVSRVSYVMNFNNGISNDTQVHCLTFLFAQVPVGRHFGSTSVIICIPRVVRNEFQ
jgi:hypothetical protein